MVTAGANQAFVNVVLTLLDPGDRVVLFVPYYFNHLMAIQMTGGAANVVFGKCDLNTLHPDLDWLQQHLDGPGDSLSHMFLPAPSLPLCPHISAYANAGSCTA
jgi:aspartate/methionine/tyrosine aminotransferase